MATVEVVQRTGKLSLPVSQLVFDSDVQCRESIQMGTVAEYKESLAAGVTFPPLVVFFDGSIHWVADGFHRGQSYREAGVTECPCDVRQGTKRDAILYAVGANSTHGLKRSNADKRRAVETLLKDAEWSKWPDRKIALQAGVDQGTVGNIRKQLAGPSEEFPQIRKAIRNGKEYTIDTSKIGKTKPIEKAAPEPEKAVVPEPEPVSESRPVGLVAIADGEPEDTEDDEEECAEVPREDLTETKEANDAIRIAKTAVDAVWNKCPPAFRWRLKASIENHLTELAEG